MSPARHSAKMEVQDDQETAPLTNNNEDKRPFQNDKPTES